MAKRGKCNLTTISRAVAAAAVTTAFISVLAAVGCGGGPGQVERVGAVSVTSEVQAPSGLKYRIKVEGALWERRRAEAATRGELELKAGPDGEPGGGRPTRAPAKVRKPKTVTPEEAENKGGPAEEEKAKDGAAEDEKPPERETPLGKQKPSDEKQKPMPKSPASFLDPNTMAVGDVGQFTPEVVQAGLLVRDRFTTALLVGVEKDTLPFVLKVGDTSKHYLGERASAKGWFKVTRTFRWNGRVRLVVEATREPAGA
jgi:hypothetical protein